MTELRGYVQFNQYARTHARTHAPLSISSGIFVTEAIYLPWEGANTKSLDLFFVRKGRIERLRAIKNTHTHTLLFVHTNHHWGKRDCAVI